MASEVYEGSSDNPSLCSCLCRGGGFLGAVWCSHYFLLETSERLFFQLTSLAQLCHPPQLDMGVVLPEAKQHKEDKAWMMGHLI